VISRAPIGKRTARLLREAIVLAHVEGWWWESGRAKEEPYPKDSEIVARVLYSASRMQDQYPALGRLAARLAEADAHLEGKD
jgi:hypothetical protein